MLIIHLPAPSGRELAASRDYGCIIYGAPISNKTLVKVLMGGWIHGRTNDEMGRCMEDR